MLGRAHLRSGAYMTVFSVWVFGFSLKLPLYKNSSENCLLACHRRDILCHLASISTYYFVVTCVHACSLIRLGFLCQEGLCCSWKKDTFFPRVVSTELKASAFLALDNAGRELMLPFYRLAFCLLVRVGQSFLPLLLLSLHTS